MTAEKLLANISRDFFKAHHIYRYRMKKIGDLSDSDVIRYCHWFSEEHNLTDEFDQFRNEAESSYTFCKH